MAALSDSALSSARATVEEALLLAQSRAREAEDVLCQYDAKMEDTVLQALQRLDECRKTQEECQQRVEALKAAVIEQERLVVAAQSGGIAAQQEAGANIPDDLDLQIGIALQPPARTADPVLANPELLSKQQKLNELSLALAEAYEAVYEATAHTDRQAKLIQDLEGLVEPILEFRHRGVFDVQRYTTGMESKDFTEGAEHDGSSIVFVDGDSSAAETPAAEEPAEKKKCFKLLTEKLQATKEAQDLKRLIDAVSDTLDEGAAVSTADVPAGAGASPGREEVVDKVKGLVELLQRQQGEIDALKGSMSHSSLSSTFVDLDGSTASVQRSHNLADSSLSSSSRRRSPLQSLAVPQQRRQNTPREKRKKARTSLVAYCGTDGFISSTAEQARMLIDLWEVFMLKSVAAIKDVVRAAISALCLHTLLHRISKLLRLGRV